MLAVGCHQKDTHLVERKKNAGATNESPRLLAPLGVSRPTSERSAIYQRLGVAGAVDLTYQVSTERACCFGKVYRLCEDFVPASKRPATEDLGSGSRQGERASDERARC